MLINQLPPVIQDIREFKLIASNGDTENEKLYNAIADLENNQYITSVTESGATRYEKMLKIFAKGSDTIEDRRFRLLALFNKQLPYTKISLENDLITMCGERGYFINVDYDNKVLTVKIELTAKTMYEVVEDYLNSITPLNIIIDLTLLYNQHLTLAKFTHSQLGAYTFAQLRNEVLK